MLENCEDNYIFEQIKILDMKLVFATGNDHKLEEVRHILNGQIDLLSFKDLDFHEDIPETADTLEGNAILKAKYIWDKFGLNCFADDTGLMVNALNGEPGVKSARYAGENKSSKDNVVKLLDRLKDKEDRSAYFITVIALIIDGELKVFEGRVEGEIISETRGEGGFGYDPVFVPNDYDQTFAELSAEIKNKISHRAKATEVLAAYLNNI